MKYLLTILAILTFSAVTLQAQDQPTKTKKIVMEKVIEENGETTVERIELEGEEAEAYLNNNGGEDGEMEMDIDVKVEEVDGSTKVWVTKNGEEMEIEIPEGEDHILMEDGDGEMHIFKIDGESEEGEKEIRVKMKMMGEEGKKGEKKIIIMKTEDHDEDELHEGHGAYDWKGDFDLEDLNEDDIETIDVRKRNGVNEITIKMKNGDVIKKKLSAQDRGTGMFFLPDNPEEDFMRGRGFRTPCDNSKPFLGISMMNIHEDSNDDSKATGVKINSVTLNSGADKAGIQAGDILVQIDDQEILNFDDVSQIVQNRNIGDEIQVSILRNGQALNLTATIGNRNCAERKQRVDGWKMHRPRSMKRNPCKPLIGFFHSETEGDKGVTIGEVIDGYPAARQNLQEGDLVVSFDKTEIDSWEQLIQLRDEHEAGDRFKMIVQRGDKKIKVTANFNDCPKDEELFETPEIELSEDIISEGSSPTEFKAFPNPSQGQLTVEYRGSASPINIQISDITGKILVDRTIEDFDGYYAQQFDFSDAAEGTLLVRMQQGDEVRVEKVILQKIN